MKTTVNIPDKTLRDAMRHTKAKTKREAIVKALEEMKKRAAKVGYEKEIVIQTGVNKKRQINLYDPDGTRIELMEPNTVDGQPAPSSTAPVPHPTQKQ